MNPTDIYHGVPSGITQLLDDTTGTRNQEAAWLAEDIKLLVARNPKITTQLFKVAVHHCEAGDLSDIKSLQNVYSTLKRFVAELVGGKYPTLLSLHYNDGLAEEGWEPPAHDQAEPTELDRMRTEIHQMKQSSLITKDDIRSLPVNTEDQYVYLKNLIGNRATAMVNVEPPFVDDTEPLAIEPKAIEQHLTAGEAIIERRKMMVQCLLNPASADQSLLEEAKNLISGGDVGLMMEMSRITGLQLNTSTAALAHVASLAPVVVTDTTAEPVAAETKPAKLTARLKADIKNVVNSITQDIPSITLEKLLDHPRFVVAAHAERDTPHNLYQRLMGTSHDIQFPPAEGACQSVSTVETSPSSSSTVSSMPSESSAPPQEDSGLPSDLTSSAQSNKQDLLCQEKSSMNRTTPTSTPTETLSDALAAEYAIPATSTGSTTSSVSETTTANGSTTSLTLPTTASAPTTSLSTLIQKRKQLESELAVVKNQIAEALAAEEAEEAALRARLQAIEEAKRALLDG